MQQLELRVLPSDDGCSVKTLLKTKYFVSTTLLNRLKRSETGLLCNGRRVHTNHILQSSDLLCVDLSDPPDTAVPEPLSIPFSVVYEDDWLLVAEKAAGIAVHAPSLSLGEPTFSNALSHYLRAPFHLVSRLDRGTSGLLIVAKCSYIHDRFRRALHTDSLHREYLGICEGHITPPEGTIDLPIGRDTDSLLRRRIDHSALPSLTRYETLRKTSRFSLLRLVPVTGRTHQLRLHLSAIGHSLAGDWLYGTEDRALISRPALHSAQLSFTHPITGEALSFSSPLPADMEALIQ